VDLYRGVLLQVEIAYFGWVGDVVYYYGNKQLFGNKTLTS